MKASLLRFKVQNFRSVNDSGWIKTEEITCLIGTNESGKTNLLLPLWKLNPANNEKISPLDDYPRKKFAHYEGTSGEEIFISAEFEFHEDFFPDFPANAPYNKNSLNKVIVHRKYNGKYEIDFPEKTINAPSPEQEKVDSFDETTFWTQANTKVLEALPRFVYYADYGNLDSEIYLPHVVANLTRPNLGEKERAKARTLKVLFEFVKLKPSEILALGGEQGSEVQQIQIDAEKKRKREILLQSASTTLTNEFKDWWKQGNYNFRFQADGNHFRIWVSDDKRKEEVELEGRIKGLQWFFSFFLVFLVESKESH